VFQEGKYQAGTGNAAMSLNVLRKAALHRLRKMKIEKKQVSVKRHMIQVTLDSDSLYEALFSE
jgi:hypothetical protein